MVSNAHFCDSAITMSMRRMTTRRALQQDTLNPISDPLQLKPGLLLTLAPISERVCRLPLRRPFPSSKFQSHMTKSNG